MRKLLLSIFFFGLAVPVWSDLCQITSPLPLPITISGCSYSGNLPSGSTSYIQNTSTPTASTQQFSVANATITTTLTLPYLTPGQCHTTNAAGQVIGTSCGSGGGSSTSSLGISSGSATNSVIVSSPTTNVVFDSNTFVGSLQGTTTSFIKLNSSSVTLQGIITAGTLGALTGNQSISLSQDASGSGTTSIAVTNASLQPNINTLSASSVTINGILNVLSTTTLSYSTTIINGVQMSWPSSGTVGNYLQYVSSNTLQWVGVTSGGTGNAVLSSTQVWTGGNTHSSSTTFNGAVVISTSISVNGSVGTSGQFLTSQGPNAQAQWTTSTGASLSSTQAWTGGNTFISSTTLYGGVNISSTIVVQTPTLVVNTTMTVTSTMSVILASAPQNTAWITLTLPSAASNPGLDIMIYKVDKSTDLIRIQGNGTDVIEGTNTITLNAPFQHASLHSLGSVGWGSGLGGIQYTPERLYAIPLGSQHILATVAASSDILSCPIYIPVPVTVTGYTYRANNSVATVSFGILDAAGNVVTSSGPVALVAGSDVLSMATPASVPPGDYYLAVQMTNTTSQIEGADSTGGSMVGCSRNTSSTGGITSLSLHGLSTTSIPLVQVLMAGKPQTFP